MLIWNSKLISTCINFQELTKSPHFGCEAFVGAKSLDNFVDVKVDLKNQIEEEFEDQLDHYVQFVDMIDFDF
jgi:hypothetical protein